MKKKSLGKNAILNGIKSAMSVAFPLITFPYVSRILQVNNLGKYNFASSVNNYFILLAGLGISTYAIREGAKHRDDTEEFSGFASEMFSINIISMIISYILLFITLALTQKFNQYKILILIFSLEIFFRTLGTEWVYTIYEDFAYITKRSIFFQICSLILVFLFVKKESDVMIYAAITVLSDAGANILNFLHAKSFCKIRITTKIKWNKHFKPILIIFATSLATTIYVNSDVTMLGFMSSDYNVGLYSVAVKIYTVIKTILSGILIVSIPRLSSYLGKGLYDKFNDTFSKIFNTMMIVVTPAVIGIFCLSKQIIQIISGSSFIEATTSLRILSLALLVCLFGWLHNSCILIPYGREKKVLQATLISAALNIGLNLILIPLWKQNATALTTFIAEGCSMVMCIYYSKGLTKINIIRKDIFSILIGCLGIILICNMMSVLNLGLHLEVSLCIISSVAIYSFILLLMKNSFAIQIFFKIKNKIKQR